MRLTGEQRYRQAVMKARIRGQRHLRHFIDGKLAILPCSDPRDDLITELERAYQAGRADMAKEMAQEQEQIAS